jgi:transcriptional regulator with PAS, ATPase and Fis domain
MEGTTTELTAGQVRESVNRKMDFKVLDFVCVPIIILDDVKKVIYANQPFADLLKINRSQIVGKLLSSLVQYNEHDIVRKTEGEYTCLELWAELGGEKHYLEIREQDIVDVQGKVKGHLQVIIDSTDQKKALFEINDLLNKAKAGDLNSRIELNVKGDYKELVSSFNQLLDAVIKPIKEAQQVLLELAKGNLSVRVGR